MLVQQSTMSSREAVLVQWSTTGALVSLSLYSRVLQDYLAGCVGTVEYYKITAKAVLVQYNSWLAVLYSRLQDEHSGGCANTGKYYRSNWEVVLVQQRAIGATARLC